MRVNIARHNQDELRDGFADTFTTCQSLSSDVHMAVSRETDLTRLFNRWPFSDVDIWVGNERIRAHKVILATGSDYFNTMFCGRYGVSRTACHSLTTALTVPTDEINEGDSPAR